ncbi:MAG: hypothetical protein J6C78_08475 [Muribaculaceae bacterium]|nr:hypothetical protein [Muribaculaceae bacterium]
MKKLFRELYGKLFRKETSGKIQGEGWALGDCSLAQPWLYSFPNKTGNENETIKPQLLHIAETQGMDATPEKSPS